MLKDNEKYYLQKEVQKKELFNDLKFWREYFDNGITEEIGPFWCIHIGYLDNFTRLSCKDGAFNFSDSVFTGTVFIERIRTHVLVLGLHLSIFGEFYDNVTFLYYLQRHPAISIACHLPEANRGIGSVVIV